MLTAVKILKGSVGLAKLERRVMKHPQTVNRQQFLSFLLQSVQIYFIPGCTVSFVLSQKWCPIAGKTTVFVFKRGGNEVSKAQGANRTAFLPVFQRISFGDVLCGKTAGADLIKRETPRFTQEFDLIK